ncbi:MULTISPECIES: delta-60 repeat domain-containing protein [unclassified Pseudomonas]|uniref:delta-60 repeat domain-containing protein n=1 Tax=unclassified Pseudomonas TaxID=196821 RepID=UPI000C2FE215|nr:MULTISPECIES: delta-60 repeat domain-containing protein [unclassified Pseudomonas]MCU1740290.1 delta-60 repeat domain-containing protein [Pseudomonas sp. 20S_6.2_Bac1]
MNDKITTEQSQRAGELDPEFNGGEILVLPGTDATDVAIAPQGRIYVVGGTELWDSKYIISGLNPDGTFDRFFNGGVPVTNVFLPGFPAVAENVLVLPDGKVLILGRVVGEEGYMFGLARYHPDGMPDLSFGVNGTAVPTYEFDGVEMSKDDSAVKDKASRYLDTDSVSLFEHDGRIYIAGRGKVRIDNKVVTLLMCLDEAGNLVQAFGNKGAVVVAHPEYHVNTRQILVANGYIYLAGFIQAPRGNHRTWVRLHMDGRLDLAFGLDGFVFEINEDYSSWGNFMRVVLQNNLKILGVGSGVNVATFVYEGLLASIDKEGGKDSDFNGGEPVLTHMDDTRSGWQDGSIQRNGYIVTCGTAGDLDVEDLVVGRYLPNGDLDVTFGSNDGWTRIDVKDWVYRAALAIQPDNGIVVTGRYVRDRISTPFVLRLKG